MWNFWKKKNKNKSGSKTDSMEFDKNKPDEELAKDFASLEFQWVKGENAGGIEKFESFAKTNDMKFIVFQSGQRINMDLLNEYMTAFPDSGSHNFDGRPQAINKNQTVTPAGTSSVNSINYGNNSGSGMGISLDTSSPIYGLLSKQKPNMVDVDISIKINLPPKELYSVLTQSFDGAEEEVVNYVISSLNIEDIKSALSDSILNTYYESRKKTEKKSPVENKEKTPSE